MLLGFFFKKKNKNKCFEGNSLIKIVTKINTTKNTEVTQK